MRRVSAWLLVPCVAGLFVLQGCSSNREIAAQDEKEPPKKEDGKPFELPKDNVGKMLGEVLPPARKQGPLNQSRAAKPPAMPMPRAAVPPSLLPSATVLVARLPSPKRTDVLRPRMVVLETFDGGLQEPALPRSPSFDAGKPVAIEAEDVSIPPPLPILAIHVPDRVPVDDFTMEASTESVLKAEIPKRTTPAPFTRSGVPEPFENRKPLPTTIPDELTIPVTDGPAVPK